MTVSVRVHRFRSPAVPARWTTIALFAFAVAALGHAAVHAWRMGSGRPHATTAATIDRLVAATAPLALVAFVGWFHRVYGNLRALGTPPRHATGWAIACWLVPFLQLYRPMQLMRELWRAADAGSHLRVALWWAASLLFLFSASLAGRRSPSWPFTVDDPSHLPMLEILAADTLAAVAAVLAGSLVHRVTTAQLATNEAQRSQARAATC